MEAKRKVRNRAPTQSRRSLMWAIAVVGLTAVLAGTLYYSQTVIRESTFQDERAFRVLDEVVTEFRNLESNRAAFLTSIGVSLAECADGPDDDADSLQKGDEREAFKAYRAQLEFSDARLCVIKLKPSPESTRPIVALAEGVCHDADVHEVGFELNVSEDRLTSVRCQPDRMVVLQESFEKATDQLISQAFFEEALLTLKDGEVLGEFPAHDPDSRDNMVKLHSAVARRFDIVNASSLLTEGPSPVAPQSGEVHTFGEGASHHLDQLQPYATTKIVRGQEYRAEILAFEAPYPLLLSGSVNESPSLYVIGLHRVDHGRQIAHALWPVGLWVAALLIGFSLVAWPLLSLEFGPAEESISPAKAIGCLVGLIILPAILTTAVASLWSDLELESQMRARASAYVETIEATLHQDLVDGAEILGSFRPIYQPFLKADANALPTCRTAPPDLSQALVACSGTTRPAGAPWLSYDGQRHPHPACALSGWPVKPSRAPNPPLDRINCPAVTLLEPDAPEQLRRWSPFRAVIALNADGKRFGPAFTSFRSSDTNTDLNLKDREYFRALKFAQAWKLEPGGHGIPVVAQRLFSRWDGSKLLELAVPLCESAQVAPDSHFCGVITGDLRMHNLIASVVPPLLEFAVIDITTGTVLFSSSETRSLAENFFVESEQNPALHAAIASGHRQEFHGQYLGDPYRFAFAPVKDVPWGVFVFYPEKAVADIPFRAGVAGLTAYVGILLAAVIVFAIVGWVWRLFKPDMRSMLELARKAWPPRSLPEWYRHISRYKAPVWVLLVLLALSLWRFSTAAIVLFASLALVVGILVGFYKPPKGPSRRSPAQQYAGCILIFLTAASILAYALFLTFQRLQLTALVRDGLAQNAFQIQSRYDLVQQDLRRWVPPDGQQWEGPTKQFPPPSTLAVHPSEGLTSSNIDLAPGLRVAYDTPGACEPGLPRNPNLFERLVWYSTVGVGSPVQERRIALSGASPFELMQERRLQRQQGCATSNEIPDNMYQVQIADGRQLSLEAQGHSNDRLIDQDGEWMWIRLLAVFAAALGTAFGMSRLAWLFTTRLLGLSASVCPATDHREVANDDREVGKAPTEDEFKRKWSMLKRPEKLALYQKASGHLINPRNEATIEKLLAEKLLKLDGWPTLRWPELKTFVLRAQTPARFDRWQRDAERGMWKSVRIPLFIFLMIIIAWLSWVAGESMKAISAILVATVAFLAQVLQLLSLARGRVPPKESA